jgi:hypothetical protein
VKTIEKYLYFWYASEDCVIVSTFLKSNFKCLVVGFSEHERIVYTETEKETFPYLKDSKERNSLYEDLLRNKADVSKSFRTESIKK